MNSIKVREYSRSRSFHDDLIHVLQDQASGERSQDQWSSGLVLIISFSHEDIVISIQVWIRTSHDIIYNQGLILKVTVEAVVCHITRHLFTELFNF